MTVTAGPLMTVEDLCVGLCLWGDLTGHVREAPVPGDAAAHWLG